MANGGMLTEPTLGIGLNSGMTTLMGEAGAEAVVPLNGGNSTMVHTTIQIDRKTIADVVGAGIVEQVRRVGGIRR